MKNVLIAIAAVAVLAGAGCLYSVAGNFLNGKQIKGSGNLVTKSIPAPDFDAIHASRGVKVVVSDQAERIGIEADDNLINLVVVEARKGNLVVTIDNQKARSIANQHITVTVPANGKIRSLDASSAAKIVAQTPLKADKFAIETSSAATVEATVEATSCSMEASSASRIAATVTATSCSLESSSAAKIEAAVTASICSVDQSSASNIDLSGSAQSLKADLSSAAKLDAAEFTAVNASVDTSSAAAVRLDCSGELKASASSGSSIRYSGDCRVTANKSSGGSIKKD